MTEEMAAAAEPPLGSFPLEEPGPLSQSRLWRLQRRYFEGANVAAWSEGTVPSYVTSNPFIAAAYARTVAAFLADWDPALDPGRPVYVVELAAGAGRFAFHFLRKFAAEQAWRRPGAAPVTYVMTEYNPALLAFWQQHPAFQASIAAGRLDFALFDAERPADLTLQVAGITLTPAGALANPLVVLANYFFDSVPHDAFYVKDGRLFASLAALTSSEAEPDPDDPALLARARLVYERRPLDGAYYGEPALDDLLEQYRASLQRAGLAFPAAGLRTVAYLARLAGGRLLLLTTDKGHHRLEDLEGRREPGFEVHGSFSVGVNYHALGQYFRGRGGEALHIDHPHGYLDPCAFLLGAPPGGYAATRRAYATALAEFGPEEYYLVQGILDREHDPLSVEQVVALLRLGGWDQRIFQKCFSDLLAGLAAAPPHAREALRAAGARLWDEYYAIGEEYDLAYDLGVLYYKLDEHAAALVYFLHSLAEHGPGAKTFYNMALCHYLLGDRPQALACAERAAALDPAFDAARAFIARLQRESRTDTP